MNTTRIGRLVDNGVVIYIRPIKHEWVDRRKPGIAWSVQVEKVVDGGVPLHYTHLDEDIDEALAGACAFAERKLGIKRKTRKRARRTL